MVSRDAGADLVGLRYHPPFDFFVGHENGMPTYGVAGLTPREIDGAAYYVLAQLRPEILQQD